LQGPQGHRRQKKRKIMSTLEKRGVQEEFSRPPRKKKRDGIVGKGAGGGGGGFRTEKGEKEPKEYLLQLV